MKKATATIFSILLATLLFSQTSVSFYHLGNTTFQNSSLNPAWIPDAKLFIGLPGLSGVHLHANNKLSYNDLFTKETDQITLDVDKALSKLQDQNLTSVQANVNLFHLGYKFGPGATISVFANERVEVDVLYPKKLIDFAWNGNDNFLDEKVRIGQVGVQASHFREIGIGYAYSATPQLDFGIRAKYMMGFFNASTPANFKANLTTSGEFFQLDAELQNAQLRTSGVDIYDGSVGDLGSHLTGNGNTGVAVDFGLDYDLNRYYSVAVSVLDLGWINWKENVVNQTLNDTTFTYRGVNLDGVGDIRQTLEDSLFNKFDPQETNDTYKTWLAPRAYVSWIYHYSRNMDFYGTAGTRYLHGQFKMLYGGGVTRRFGRVFTGSLSATKLPQQFFNVGAAFAVQGGPVQLYMAADQIINFSAPDFKAIDFRIGINFQFRGRDENLQSSGSVTTFANGKPGSNGTLAGPKGVDSGIFLGKRVKAKKKDGIYSVIPKQRRREIKARRSAKKRVSRTSLNGRTGVKNKNE